MTREKIWFDNMEKSFQPQIWCFWINLMVNYDQPEPKLHVSINILMKIHHILTYSWILNPFNENMDKMASPL
jgi:hypothetical protein